MKWTLLGCSIGLCLTANVWAQVPDPDPELGEEMQTLVKSYITRNPEVSVDDAVTRLAVQTEIMQSMEDLRQEFSDRLTEISLQHIPDQHILVELKGAGAVADVSSVLKVARPGWFLRRDTSTPSKSSTPSSIDT